MVIVVWNQKWLTDGRTEWQGHLLRFPGQLWIRAHCFTSWMKIVGPIYFDIYFITDHQGLRSNWSLVNQTYQGLSLLTDTLYKRQKKAKVQNWNVMGAHCSCNIVWSIFIPNFRWKTSWSSSRDSSRCWRRTPTFTSLTTPTTFSSELYVFRTI